MLETYLYDTTCFSDRLVQLQIGIPTTSSQQPTSHKKRDVVLIELESMVTQNRYLTSAVPPSG